MECECWDLGRGQPWCSLWGGRDGVECWHQVVWGPAGGRQGEDWPEFIRAHLVGSTGIG